MALFFSWILSSITAHCCIHMYNCFNDCYSQSNSLYSSSSFLRPCLLMMLTTTVIWKLQNLFNQPYWVHIMPLVISSLRGRHTHSNTRTYVPTNSNFLDKSKFKKPGTCGWYASGLEIKYIIIHIACYNCMYNILYSAMLMPSYNK